MVDMSTGTLSLSLNGRGFAVALPLASKLSQSKAPYGHPRLSVLCPVTLMADGFPRHWRQSWYYWPSGTFCDSVGLRGWSTVPVNLVPWRDV